MGMAARAQMPTMRASEYWSAVSVVLIACEKSGRQARLIELEPKYCDVIVRRWLAFTGKEAKLESDGKSYREVAGTRTGVIS